MAIVLDGTTGLAGAATGALNGSLGATTPSTVVATTVTASGTMLVGTTTSLGNVSTIAGANAIANSYGNLAIMSTDAQAADKGGQITFGGKYTTGGGDYFFGAIAGRKSNGTTGSAAGYLGFSTCSSGGTLTQQMTLDNSGNLQFNSGYGSVATAYGCRAWVNFNGTGTVAINASGNVSSITDSGVGLYIVNLTNAMPDANYSYALDSKLSATGTGNLNEGATLNSALATTSLSIRTGSKAANTAADHAIVTCEIFR